MTVAACTFRRPYELRQMLNGVLSQVFQIHEKPLIDVLVVENGDSRDGRAVCEEIGKTDFATSLRYVHEPCQGISYARNAVLENVPEGCDFLAMIDDDEVPEPQWLESLLMMQSSTGAAVVRGAVVPIFEEPVPQWVRAGEYFGWPASHVPVQDGGEVRSGATNNALLDWRRIRALDLRFDTALATTGGEDTVFFSGILRAGYGIVYAARARVHEHVPSSRTSQRAMLRLSYRYGVNRLRKQLRVGGDAPRLVLVLRLVPAQLVKGVRHLLVGSLQMLAGGLRGWFTPESFGPGLMRVARGAGLLVGLFGVSYRYYQ